MYKTDKLEEYIFDVYLKNKLTATVKISSDRKSVYYKWFSDEVGVSSFLFENPTIEQMFDFLESLCMNKKRNQHNEYLTDLGLEEYNPYEIVKHTHGVMWADFCS